MDVKEKKQTETPQTTAKNTISMGRLIYESIPEMWTFQFLVSIVMAFLLYLFKQIATSIIESSGTAFTTANLGQFMLNWRMPLLLAVGFALLYVFIGMELFSQIYLSDDLLNGRPGGVRRELGRGFRSLRSFLNPIGFFILLYIFIAVPLVGIGFSVSLTRTFRIPNFIMDVVLKTPAFAIAYVTVVLILLWVGIRSIFVLHGVLLSGMKPAEARRASIRLFKVHWKNLIVRTIKVTLVLTLVQFVASLLFVYLPGIAVESMGEKLPHDVRIDITGDMSGIDPGLIFSIIAYRTFAAMTVLGGSYLYTIVVLIDGGIFMLYFTRWYLEYTRGPQELWPERPKRSLYRRKLVVMLLVLLACFIVSLVVGIFYDQAGLDTREPVKIVAHRTGGDMASENSIEGLEKAIEHGCYAAETDVQRTLDGYYIINHDADFSRLTGVARTPESMTMEEVQELRIKDTTGSGALLPVPTLEEMLPVIKDRINLFIELKGATADRQMVDDVVAMVRKYDCVKDVTLISLSYDVIDYAETTYPEFETGVLFFLGLGDVSRLNCDLLIMEEDIGTEERIGKIHASGKKAIVWTVNTEQSMNHFLDPGLSTVDGIITDKVELAEKVRDKLGNRTEYDVLRSMQIEALELG